MNGLSVRVIETAEAVIVQLEGEAGITAADGLQLPLQRLTVKRPAVVVFDMAELTFVASLFLGLLVNFRRGLIKHGTKVQLAGVRPNVLDVLRTTRLEELFEFVAAAPAPVSPAPAS